jgi:hypothetical protein
MKNFNLRFLVVGRDGGTTPFAGYGGATFKIQNKNVQTQECYGWATAKFSW